MIPWDLWNGAMILIRCLEDKIIWCMLAMCEMTRGKEKISMDLDTSSTKKKFYIKTVEISFILLVNSDMEKR